MSWKLFDLLVGIILIYSIIPTMFDRIIWRKPFTKDRKIALTFDDGPGIYTAEILNLLEEYKVKASFFLVTDKIGDFPEIIEQMIDGGHEICLHSKAHRWNMFRGYKSLDKDFKLALELLQGLGLKIKYYRPTWGVLNLSIYILVKKYRLKKIIWNVMVGDWRKTANKEILYNKLIKKTKPGSIICIHDAGSLHGPKNILGALKTYLPQVIADEYEFVKISDIYGER